MQYIKDPGYLEKNREKTESEGIEAKRPNEQLEASNTMLQSSFRMQKLHQVVCTGSIRGKE